MNYFNGPTLVCRCGRVFFDGEDPWPHVREEHERAQATEKYMREMQQAVKGWGGSSTGRGSP